MKKILIVTIILGAGLWWNLVGGRTISEADIDEYYQNETKATLQRNPDELCGLLAEDFQLEVEVFSSQGKIQVSYNREEMCEHFTKTYESIQTIGERLGGMAQLDFSRNVDDVTIAEDKKSASVEASYTFNVAGSVVKLNGATTDTLIRRNGKTLLLHRTGTETMNSGS